MKEEMLEIMIGKYLDGQITAGEQRVLEAELDNNFQARELLQQLQDLHQRSREVVVSEVLDRGKDVEEIFERAWQQHKKHSLFKVIKISGRLRFVAGLAAGLVMGLSLHFTLLTHSTPPIGKNEPIMVVQSTDNATGENIQKEPIVVAKNPGNKTNENRQNLTSPQNIIRNVEWYTFTDENGDQWLVEGLRENKVKTAAYYEAL